MKKPSDKDRDKARGTADIFMHFVSAYTPEVNGYITTIHHGEKFKEFLVLSLLSYAGFEVELGDGK